MRNDSKAAEARIERCAVDLTNALLDYVDGLYDWDWEGSEDSPDLSPYFAIIHDLLRGFTVDYGSDGFSADLMKQELSQSRLSLYGLKTARLRRIVKYITRLQNEYGGG